MLLVTDSGERFDPIKRSYSLNDVMQVSGASRRQVDEWIKTDIISADQNPGKGKARSYSFLNIYEAALAFSFGRIIHLHHLKLPIRNVSTMGEGNKIKGSKAMLKAVEDLLKEFKELDKETLLKILEDFDKKVILYNHFTYAEDKNGDTIWLTDFIFKPEYQGNFLQKSSDRKSLLQDNELITINVNLTQIFVKIAYLLIEKEESNA